jgi:hypothetical protein
MDSLNKLEELIRSAPSFFNFSQHELLEHIAKIKEEIEEKESRSIIWSVHDFEAKAGELKGLNWKYFYDESKFQKALIDMIANHDANHGINWYIISYYLDDNCKLNK